MTGASGFLGETLARRLAQRHTVFSTFYKRQISIPGVSASAVDLTDANATARLVQRCQPDVIVHCAATTDVAWCQQSPTEAERAIVGASVHLVDALRRYAPASLLISISTDLVFDGENPPYDENASTLPLSTYGQCKAAAERVVLAFSNTLVLRPSLIYGRPTTYKGSFLGWMVDTLRQGKPLPLFADEFRTPIWANDLCSAIERASERRQTGLYHAGGPERLSRLEMGAQVCAAFGFDTRLLCATRLSESVYPAPRPCDVSLCSDKLWIRVGHRPSTFSNALRRIAAST